MNKQTSSYTIGTESALSSILVGENTYITGPAGSGKSHLIETVRTMFPEDTLIVAPTGVAALNVRGMTMHRAFGLSSGISQEKDTRNVFSEQQAKLLSSKSLSRVVIDEVSMVRSDKMYEMDYKLRHFQKCDEPFGGLQVIAFGDGFQISPVLKQTESNIFHEIYGSEIPFGCWSWQACAFNNVILKDVFRQKDAVFAKHLNDMRVGRNVASVVKFLNDNCYNPVADPNAITLTNTNKLAETINQYQFELVNGESKVFIAQKTGEFKDTPVPEKMELKIGLKVMITSNDGEAQKKNLPARYVNGTIGHIVGFDKFGDGVIVDIKGNRVTIRNKQWDNIVYDVSKKDVEHTDSEGNITIKKKTYIKEKVIGSYSALPIKLGYALTIHKAQGLTLEAVNVDLGNGAFTAGQAYVAIGRATCTETLRLLRPLRAKDIIVDKRIVNFYNNTFPGE